MVEIKETKELSVIIDSVLIKGSYISRLELVLPPQRQTEATMYELRLHLSRKQYQVPIRFVGGLEGSPPFDQYMTDHIQELELKTSRRTKIVENPNLRNFGEFLDDLERIKKSCIKYQIK